VLLVVASDASQQCGDVCDLGGVVSVRDNQVTTQSAQGHECFVVVADAGQQAVWGSRGRLLVVSLDTVKKHVGHVLSKLGAANRTEAVTRARQLGLIP
jgi:hypothetical protein